MARRWVEREREREREGEGEGGGDVYYMRMKQGGGGLLRKRGWVMFIGMFSCDRFSSNRFHYFFHATVFIHPFSCNRFHATVFIQPPLPPHHRESNITLVCDAGGLLRHITR